mmetsp:Transcript_13682/g.29590  ORF Transcript_13682/g.29590 Transcript_13682/m.29590 type:complete len:681 (-) Transcript_13682:199-2241(-)
MPSPVSLSFCFTPTHSSPVDDALPLLNMAVASNPIDPEFLLATIDAHAKARNLVVTHRTARLCVRLFPLERRAWHQVALSAIRLKNHAAAVSTLRWTLRLPPSSTTTGKDKEHPEDTDSQILHQASHSLSVWSNAVAVALIKEAEAVVSRPAALRNLGMAYNELRRYEDAEYLLNAAAKGGDAKAACKHLDILKTIAAWDRLETPRFRVAALLSIAAQEYETASNSAVGVNVADYLDNSTSCLEPNDALYLGFPPHLLRLLAILSAQRAVNATSKISLHTEMWFRADGGMALLGRVRQGTLRIGYLSSDFKLSHPVGQLLASVLAHHGRQGAQVLCYNNRPDNLDGSPEDWRTSIHKACSAGLAWVSEWSDRALAERMNSDELSVVVNLNGWSGYDRNPVLALHVAPAQLQLIGYAGPSGGGLVDYVVSDRVSSPPEYVAHYTEKLSLMPGTHHVLAQRDHFPARPPVTSTGLSPSAYPFPADATVLACFNRAKKIDPWVFNTWLRALQSNSQAVLWLCRIGLSAAAEERLASYAGRAGLRDRVFFVDAFRWADHIAAKARASVSLDTAAYNGHTSAADALWSGVPQLTMAGDTMASRVAASFLVTANITTTLARNPQEYDSLADILAKERSDVRRSTYDRVEASPLFRVNIWVHNLQRLMRMQLDLSILQVQAHVIRTT